MKNEKANKKAVCKKIEKTNILVEGSEKVLRNKNLSSLRDKNEKQGGEEMTTNELFSLIKWLKKEGYTLEKIIEVIEYIANKK